MCYPFYWAYKPKWQFSKFFIYVIQYPDYSDTKFLSQCLLDYVQVSLYVCYIIHWTTGLYNVMRTNCIQAVITIAEFKIHLFRINTYQHLHAAERVWRICYHSHTQVDHFNHGQPIWVILITEVLSNEVQHFHCYQPSFIQLFWGGGGKSSLQPQPLLI